MQRYSIHLCLVSDQPTPNVVPACDSRYRPEKVVLLTAEKHRTHAAWVKKVLNDRNVATEIWAIKAPYDFEHIRARIEELLQREDMTDIALNVTGGSKMMALAAHEIFSSKGLPVFYVQPHKDLILSLHPYGPAVEIQDKLNLSEFMFAHGFEVSTLRYDPVAPSHSQLGRILLDDIGKHEKAIGAVNYLASTAENKDLLSDHIGPRQTNVKGFHSLVELLTNHGLLRHEDGRLRFTSEADRFFVNGGWLEEFLFSCVMRLGESMKIQDVAMGVEVCSPSGSRNEIDVAILYNNRLHIIECKTRRFKNTHGEGAKSLYRIDCLRDFGGVTSKAMLASYRELPEADYGRAKDLGVKVLSGEDLLHFEDELKSWLLDKKGTKKKMPGL